MASSSITDCEPWISVSWCSARSELASPVTSLHWAAAVLPWALWLTAFVEQHILYKHTTHWRPGKAVRLLRQAFFVVVVPKLKQKALVNKNNYKTCDITIRRRCERSAHYDPSHLPLPSFFDFFRHHLCGQSMHFITNYFHLSQISTALHPPPLQPLPRLLMRFQQIFSLDFSFWTEISSESSDCSQFSSCHLPTLLQFFFYFQPFPTILLMQKRHKYRSHCNYWTVSLHYYY